MSPFFSMTSRIFLLYKMYDSIKLNRFLENMTQRIEIFERIKDSKNWTFFKNYSKNWTYFSVWLKEFSPFSKILLEELNPLFECLNELIFFLMTQRIVHCFFFFFFQYDSKTWAFFSKYDLQELNLLKNMTQRIELVEYDLEPRIIFHFDSNNWIWLKALNPPSQYDSKNWTLFLNMTHRNFSKL